MCIRREKIAGAGEVAGFSGFPHEEKEKFLPFMVRTERFPESSFRHRPTGKQARPFRQGLQQLQ